MSREEKRKQAIERAAREQAQDLVSILQEPFVQAKIDTEVKLNKKIDEVIENFREELSTYLSTEVDISSQMVYIVLQDTSNRIREVSKVVMSQISPIDHTVAQVFICNAMKECIDLCLACQVEQKAKLEEIAASKKKELVGGQEPSRPN